MKAQHPPTVTLPWLKERPPQPPRQTHPPLPGLTDEQRLAVEESRRAELEEEHQRNLAEIEEANASRAFVRLIEAAEREDEIRTILKQQASS